MWAAVWLLVPALAGGITAAVYVDSVPLPADPVTPQASTLYYRDGRTVLARVGTHNHNDVPLSAVPEPVRRAVLAAEDRDFYDHAGISVRGVLRAAVANVGGRREGASTITQQYARNAFLTQDVSLGRKAREFALAIKIERRFGKDEILQRYLNTIYYGRGAYGIAAAAYAYFGVTVDRLDGAQGAVLAATIKDPYGFDPDNDAKAARQRWSWIVQAQRDAGWLSAAPPYPKVPPPSAADAGPNGVVIDRVERELATHGVNSQALHTRGLTVVTTVDAQAQRAALRQVEAHLSGQPKGLRVALVAVDPATGGVRAYYGGRQRGYFDDASAAHPAASTFKPIVLAAALLQGISAQSRWDGSSPRLFPGRLGVPLQNRRDLQCPDCTLVQAMIDSLNTPFYAVAEVLGADVVRRLAHELGVSTRYGELPTLVDGKGDPRPGRTRPDIALGRYAVTPADLATVYGTLAGGGVRHERYCVESVTTPDAEVLWRARVRARPVVSRAVAADVTDVLNAVVQHGGVLPGRPAAGKTGTQQWGNTRDNQDAWMAGYTPELASAVWIGRADPGPIRDRRGRAIEGGTIPARLWSAFTRDALSGHPVTPLPRPAHLGTAVAFDLGPPGPTPPGPPSSGRKQPGATPPGPPSPGTTPSTDDARAAAEKGGPQPPQPTDFRKGAPSSRKPADPATKRKVSGPPSPEPSS